MRWASIGLRALPPLFLIALIVALVTSGGDDSDQSDARSEGRLQVPPSIAESPPADPGCSGFGRVEPVPDEWRLEFPAHALTATPFFAPRAGVPPATGSPTLAGVHLPPGSRCPRHWASDLPVAEASALAASLIKAFPETGLWPILWEFPETPDHYLDGSGDPRIADGVDVAGVIRRLWRMYRPDEDFPGLARPQTGMGLEEFADSFGALMRASLSSPVAYLVLVPAHRPSDVMSVVGFGGTAVLRDEHLAAVLRSWEDRFQAVPVVVGPGTLTLAVGAPPASWKDALRLAHEQLTVAPDTPVRPADLARSLRSGAVSPAIPSRNAWPLGWPD